MDEGRLGHVRKRENSQRKYVCILNDIAKTRWDQLDDALTREKYETGIRFDRSVVSLRRTVVKQRILQQCMKTRREDLRNTEKWLGTYGGKDVHAFSRDIERYLFEMHPKRRRLKKIQKLKSEFVERGKILSPSAVQVKMKDYFNKITDEDSKIISPSTEKRTSDETEGDERVDIFKRSRNFLPPLRGFVQQYYKPQQKEMTSQPDDRISKAGDTIINTGDNLTARTAIEKITDKESVDLSKGQRIVEQNDLTFERKRSLILPPIQPTKDIVRRRN